MSDPRLPASYLQPGSSSFSDFLARQAPDLLPGRRSVPQGNAADLAPHGTTIVAVAFPGGVLLAGDRRATMGNIIASRGIEKVFPTDEFSAASVAGFNEILPEAELTPDDLRSAEGVRRQRIAGGAF